MGYDVCVCVIVTQPPRDVPLFLWRQELGQNKMIMDLKKNTYAPKLTLPGLASSLPWTQSKFFIEQEHNSSGVHTAVANLAVTFAQHAKSG